MSIRSVILATATLCAYVADAHMIMAEPVPFSVDKIDNGPINQQQWPCKINLGYTVSTMNAMKVGEEQTLSFKGSAVHGGGSCQLSVTTDTEPSTSSKFKVIESIEGGCPGVEGPLDWNYTLPDSIPNGKATFAWTWFAKLSGGPEMYMNCAPIEVTGGASDTSKFDALPDMFVANLPGVVECKTATSKATKFPNPGQTVISGDNSSDIEDPTGSDCGASSGSSPAPSGSAGASASSAAGGQASAAPAAGGNNGMYTPPAGAGATSAVGDALGSASTPAAAPTSAAGGASTPAAAPTSAAGGASGGASAPAATSESAATSAAATGGAGGVFAPGASSAAPVASTQTTLVTVTGTPSTPSTPDQTTAAASEPAASTPAAGTPAASAPAASTPAAGTSAADTPAASTPAAGTGAASAAPTTTPAAGGSGSGSSTCTTNGAIVCSGTTQFGICDNGSVTFMAVAAGTTCTNGAIAKRAYNSRVARRNRRSLIGHVHTH